MLVVGGCRAVVGNRYSVVGTHLAQEATGKLSAIGDGSFDYAQDDMLAMNDAGDFVVGGR